ncbi:MAG: two-component system sensor histidine kinase BaeS [Lysobacterales bacterium]|jgi:two-component system sensor histidine kinase BaeS
MKLKLIHKLLIALFVCTALVLVLITLITRASIGRGFVDFLQQQERSKLEQLVPELVSWYGSRQSWDAFLESPREFHELIASTLGRGGESGTESRRQPPAGRRPPPGGPRGGPRDGSNDGAEAGRRDGPRERTGPDALHQRIFLLNADHYAIVGQVPAGSSQDQWLAIDVGGTTVGYLGVAMQRGIELPEEEAFLVQLRENLLIGLATGLAVAALLAWILARHLSGPINKVAGGIRAVAAGDFDTRLEPKGSDEISKLADDVNRLSTALKEHETARKRWMSDIAHELRTPLAIIRGELEAMSDGVRPMDIANLDSVQDEVNHLASLVDDLHNLALTDSGALAYKMQIVDLDELLQLATGSFTARAAQKELQLEYASPGQRVFVKGDEQRLRQLFRNLLDNSVRYTDAGGRISVALTNNNGSVQLTISDSKPGASSDECERLFERLYRLEGSRNRNSGGSGLGLSICRNIVEAHGGSISAAPGPDGGILITTILPLET